MINVRIQQKEVKKLTPKITVLGVGGAGGNAVNNMISSGLQGCDFVVCNTDAQALDGSLSENKIQLGVTVTSGLGAGAKPEIGRAAAEESLDEVMQYLEGANMAFITAGMGGGTGTGAAPVIARACREKGVLTVGVVTKPFHFEGSHRMRMAEQGIEEMQEYVDTLIVIPNQNLFRVANEKTTFAEAFKMADSVLQSGVRGVTDLMVMPGLINLDFADIRSAMLEMGKAMMGTGEADGERRAVEAAESAINNPLLDDVSMQGARGVIINVTGGMDMTLYEVDEACNRIRDEVDPNANIIFGSTFDEKLEGSMRVSVVATGIDAEEMRAGKPVKTGGFFSGGNGGKPERAQPNTNVTATQEVKTLSQSASDGNLAVRAQVSETTAVQAGTSQGVTQTVTAPLSAGFTAPAKAEGKPAYQPQVLRGQVQNETFIPPKPAEPEQMVDYGSFVSQQPVSSPSFPEEVQTARVMQAEPEQSGFGWGQNAPVATPNAPSAPQAPQSQPQATSPAPGYNLRPPVPGAGAQARKKSPSLFERITNPLWGHAQDDEGDTSGGHSSAGGETGGLSPQVKAPSQAAELNTPQGRLDIDTPQADSNEDELDIPAFLRRQAN